MNAPSALSSLYFSAPPATGNFQEPMQPLPVPVSKPKANSTVTILPAPTAVSVKTDSASSCPSASVIAPMSPSTPPVDALKSKLLDHENQNQIQQPEEMPSPSPLPSPVSATGKRKRLDMDDELTSFLAPTPTKRKGSSDFLRKGQWTNTEERLARLLIEAFEDGYLPIYTGIRLRGYLAVQLQCDPMRVSKKLCAGTIDGKPVPKNYGQKKFKLRKKPLWDCEEAERRIAELERLTKALWNEARMKKPSFLTLSTTRNVSKRGDDESASSPSSPADGHMLSSTPKSKKQKVFPIIYLNLSKKLKHYSVRGLDSSSSSGSESASPSNDSDSDSEPVRLDGESLQAAYDLLTLCSPRGSKGKSKKRASKKSKGISAKEDTSSTDASSEDAACKEASPEDKSSADKPNEDKSKELKAAEDEPSQDISTNEAPGNNVSVEDAPDTEVSKADPSIADDGNKDLSCNENFNEVQSDKAADPVGEPQPVSEDTCMDDSLSASTSST